MLKQDSYDVQQNRENILKLRAVLRELPPFCRDFSVQLSQIHLY